MTRNKNVSRVELESMYDHNDKVADIMKANLEEALFQAHSDSDEDRLREIAKTIGYVYEEDFILNEILEETLYSLHKYADNDWLNTVYPDAVKEGFVPALEIEMYWY